MGLLNLSAEKPTPGTLGDANQISNAFTEIEAAVNSIDESNFASGKTFDTTKIKQGGAAVGQALVWDGTNWAPGGSAPVGTIHPFVGTGAQVPSGFLLCDGVATVLRSSPLGVLLAGRFGPGNNVDTYNVPNFKGRVPVGLDVAQGEFDVLGDAGGAKTHLLTYDESGLRDHAHQIGPYSLSPSGPENFFAAAAGNAIHRQSDGLTVNSGNANAINPHNNLQPYMTVNFIIKT